jgi:hypothetical protein
MPICSAVQNANAPLQMKFIAKGRRAGRREPLQRKSIANCLIHKREARNRYESFKGNRSETCFNETSTNKDRNLPREQGDIFHEFALIEIFLANKGDVMILS